MGKTLTVSLWPSETYQEALSDSTRACFVRGCIVLMEELLLIEINGRAEEFNVTLAFLLQQAAWLYERHLAQVRAQLRKVNRPVSIGTPPLPSSASGSGHAMTRGGSHGKVILCSHDSHYNWFLGSRVPSSLASRNPEQVGKREDVVSPELPSQVKGKPLAMTVS